MEMELDQAEDDVEHDDIYNALVRLRDVQGSPSEHVPPAPGPTLLPAPIASAISFATRSTSFALRVGTFIGGYSLGAAKVTTLSSLEVGRGILEGILSRAGKEVRARSRSELGRTDAETILERSLESLHQTMAQVVFWTSASFHITSTTVSSVSQISQLFLSVLDQFFGSTDSSRAIASIITLIRREFQNPATGVQGEKVGVVDLLIGVCGLAYLQNWCRKTIQEESRRLGQVEIVWDVVVLNDGERVDVRDSDIQRSQAGTGDFIEAIAQHGARRNSTDEDDQPESQLKRQILNSLPKDARVSISTSTTTTKVITVDIKGATEMLMPSLPGLDLVRSEVSNPTTQEESQNYRVVYKVSRNKVRNTADESENEDDRQSYVELIDDEEPQSPYGIDIDQPPPVPPKAARPTAASAAKGRPNAPGERRDGHVRSVSNSSAGSASSPRERSFPSSLPKPTSEHAANQKRTRKPLDESRKSPRGLTIDSSTRKTTTVKNPEPVHTKVEKKGGIRGVLKKGSVPGFANFLNREPSSDVLSPKTRSSVKPPWGSYKPPPAKQQTKGLAPDRTSSLIPTREAPQPPQRGNPNYFSSRDLGNVGGSPVYRSPSRNSYQPLQDTRRSSVVSLTDTFSIQSFESRPTSPTSHRNSGVYNPRSSYDAGGKLPSPQRDHHRARSQNFNSYAPSIYTLNRDSQASLVLSSFHPRSAYSDSEAVDTLRRNGTVDGMFPNFHILRNITRYSRYASAIYGSNFLKLMGINKDLPAMNIADDLHQDVRSFAHHTELPSDSILLASFVDPQGGSDSTGSTDTGIPLIHTVALDKESKAVVLSCRGTLGFEDVLADMMCDYDDLVWRGKPYKVHKGIHASARRLLYGGDGRVLVTLKEALEEFPDYGLILCGHSLGGAVTALLGAMLAEPAMTGTAFVTSAEQHSRLLTAGGSSESSSHICLPSGRPIHVYAYGPPATMSPTFQKATRGLITSTVHGNDIVPYLSLGVLHDLQALALAFKTDNNEAKAEVRRRIWEGLQSGLADQWYNNGPTRSNDQDDKWAYAALKTLRASMMSSKLLPPGEVFSIESTPCLRRDAFLQAGTEQIGRPATRIVLKYIREVEAQFREVKFGASMLLDHSPGRYEDALRRLTLGVLET
ncbi:Uu.00g109260.m01.CDS01 [Anthostomella pinea]|uniref:sn-1-specific diacylglycerol lipase n=1 Tax=Anthostomella pinea TaxID=933095 RepID=A0AAI8VFQ4_9PEZI|nr:Uu.00g109260.m01.CDS01 [Anthostomella pinea]